MGFLLVVFKILLMILGGALLLIIAMMVITNIETIIEKIYSFLFPRKVERLKIQQRLIQEALEKKEREERQKREEEEKFKDAERLKYINAHIERQKQREHQKQLERQKYINEIEKYKQELKRKIFIIERDKKNSNVRMINGVPVDSLEDLSIFELGFSIRNNVNSYSEDKLEQEFKEYKSGMYSYELECALNNFDILFIEIGDEEYPDSLIVNSSYFFGCEDDTIKEFLESLQKFDRLNEENNEEMKARENYNESLHRERTLNGYYNEYDD